MVHDKQWQAGFLVKSLEQRRKIAVDMRALSKEKTGDKTEAIMDVNQQAVIETMTKNQVPRLIHGHTHRPDVHELLIENKPARRFVLGDWYEQGSVLECSPDGCELQSIAVK
jgi:UDP-2,3-diacylglucosamine hydrolase